MRLLITVVLFLLFPRSVFSGEVYKCVDGKSTTYSALPCGTNPVLYEVDMLTVIPPRLPDSNQVVNRDVTPNGVIKISYDRRLGGYFVNAVLDGYAIRAQIDTGATSSAISSDVAKRIGATACHASRRSHTANGTVDVCIDTISQITLNGRDEFVFKNVRISVMPDMQMDMLLGLDLLNRLNVSQRDGIMTLAK